MFSSVKTLTSTALALIFIASPAFAAEINAEGAAKLKTVIETTLEQRKNIQKAAGGDYLLEGPVKVEPADKYYAVTLPHIKIKEPTGQTIDVGMIAANVIPGASDTEWKAAIAMPTPMRFISKDGKESGEVSIGNQKAVGIWDTQMNSFLRLDATYGDLVFKDTAGKLEVKVGNANVRNQLTRDAATGMVSGPASASINDIAMTSPTEKGGISIKNVRADATIKDFDPKIGESVQQQMSAIGQTGGDFMSVGGIGFYNLISDMIGKSSDAFSVKMSMTDINIHGVNAQTQAPEGSKLSSFGFGFSMEGFRQGSVKTGLQLKYDGLEIQDQANADKDIIPQAVNLDLNINNLPVAQLIELGKTTVQQSSDPNSMAGMQAMMTLPKLLTDAGTNVTHTLDVTAPVYKASGNGVVNADMKAVNGFTADQSLTLDGLDKLIEIVTAESNKPGNPEAESLKKLLGSLAMLQMVGQKAADNPDRRTYKMVVDQQGKSTLNGTDMSAIMGMGGGAGAGAPAQMGAPEEVSPLSPQ